MNPLDLRGPEFLLFYTIFAAVVIFVANQVRKSAERRTVPQLSMEDPYLIAYLRAGANGALRSAAISLVDRKLLVDKDPLLESVSGAAETVRYPIEKEVARYFAKGRAPSGLYNDLANSAALAEYKSTLEANDLLAAPDIQRKRFLLFAYTAAALAGMSGWKILVALARGRSNIQFLVMLTAFALFGAWMVLTSKKRTAAGDAFLEDVQTLFGDLHNRLGSIRPGGANKELVWAAALFGAAAIPQAVFPFVPRLMPLDKRGKPWLDDSVGWGHWTSGSSGCSSGCSSSCGGSCGGGCGGGCGGCGS